MSDDEQVIGETRWPSAVAVLAAMVLTILLPDAVRIGPNWLLPLAEGILLIALIVGDPGKIDRSSKLLRALSLVLVAVLVLQSVWATAFLIKVLIQGGPETKSAGKVLAAGAVVWVLMIIAFALLYWELDGGGVVARAHRMPEHPDLAFTQQLNPELAPPGWRPKFIDYLHLALTTSTAFSPTDVMPLASWAKIAMALQTMLSLAILALVIARAVNVFT
jgi:hypothetical protein